MNSNPEHFKLGLFVLTGLGLLVAGVLFFSTGALSEEIYQIETYIDESVHGLEIGSPVKHRGKKIGTVNDISFVRVEYDLRPEDPQFSEYGRYVIVRMTIDNPPFRTDHADQVTGVVAQEIRNGLRTRLASQGITGLMYIEIDYVDPERNPALATSWVPKFDYIPSTTSTITQLVGSAENVFAKLEETDIIGVAAQLKTFLQHADEALVAAELPARSAELSGLIAELQARIAGPEIDAMLNDAMATTASLRGPRLSRGERRTAAAGRSAHRRRGTAGRLRAVRGRSSAARTSRPRSRSCRRSRPSSGERCSASTCSSQPEGATRPRASRISNDSLATSPSSASCCNATLRSPCGAPRLRPATTEPCASLCSSSCSRSRAAAA